MCTISKTTFKLKTNCFTSPLNQRLVEVIIPLFLKSFIFNLLQRDEGLRSTKLNATGPITTCLSHS